MRLTVVLVEESVDDRVAAGGGENEDLGKDVGVDGRVHLIAARPVHDAN